MVRSICLIACWFGTGPTLWCSSAMIGCRNSTRSRTIFTVSARALTQCNPGMLMPARLLQRQISLLEYLTSADAIFGEGADAPPVPDLQGFDPAPLRLEACFSHEKRMEKIIAAFPRTF